MHNVAQIKNRVTRDFVYFYERGDAIRGIRLDYALFP